MLKALVAEWNEDGGLNIQWSSISIRMPGRSGKQCRERWNYCLRPNIKKGVWSQDEDQLLDRLQNQMGNKWSTIAASIPGRTDNDVKNRWYARKKSAARYQQCLSISCYKPEGDRSRFPTEKNAIETTEVTFTPKSDAVFVRSCSVDSNLPLQKPPAYRYVNEIHASDATFVRSCSVDTTLSAKPLSDLSEHHVNALHTNDAPFVLSNVPLQMSSTDQNVNAVYANEIFSPSFFPRQLGMSTTMTDSVMGVAGTPFTPLMVLAAVSSCHSGPFMSDIHLFNNRALESFAGEIKSHHDDDARHDAGMTPLPYKNVEKSDDSKGGSPIPRILLGV